MDIEFFLPLIIYDTGLERFRTYWLRNCDFDFTKFYTEEPLNVCFIDRFQSKSSSFFYVRKNFTLSYSY